MNANTGRTILGSLLPLISNPTALAAIGIGAAGWVIYSLITGDEDEESCDTSENAVSSGSEPFDEPYEAVYETVAATVPERLGSGASTALEPVASTVEEPLWDDPGFKEQRAPSPVNGNVEQAKKEMIRQAMSELGKRSGAARRRKAQPKN